MRIFIRYIISNVLYVFVHIVQLFLTIEMPKHVHNRNNFQCVMRDIFTYLRSILIIKSPDHYHGLTWGNATWYQLVNLCHY